MSRFQLTLTGALSGGVHRKILYRRQDTLASHLPIVLLCCSSRHRLLPTLSFSCGPPPSTSCSSPPLSSSTSPPRPASLSPSDRSSFPRGSCSPSCHPWSSLHASWAPPPRLCLSSSCKFCWKSSQVHACRFWQGWQVFYYPLSFSVDVFDPPLQNRSPRHYPRLPPDCPSSETPLLTPPQRCPSLAWVVAQVSRAPELEPSSQPSCSRCLQPRFAPPPGQVLKLVGVLESRSRKGVLILHCTSWWVLLQHQGGKLRVVQAHGDPQPHPPLVLLVEKAGVLTPCLMRIRQPYAQLEEAHCHQPLVADLGPV